MYFIIIIIIIIIYLLLLLYKTSNERTAVAHFGYAVIFLS
jgi:hypothetical protein